MRAYRQTYLRAQRILATAAASYREHPVRVLVDKGIAVTINTDDRLVFHRSVSEEYLTLYHSQILSAEELDLIRETGVQRHSS